MNSLFSTPATGRSAPDNRMALAILAAGLGLALILTAFAGWLT